MATSRPAAASHLLSDGGSHPAASSHAVSAARARRWLKPGKAINLAAGEYLGNLYRYGFDTPEAHVIRKALYYGFFVEPHGTTYRGDLELRGLGPGSYRIEDYVNRRMLGTARGPTVVLKDVNFTNNLRLRVVPVRQGGPGK